MKKFFLSLLLLPLLHSPLPAAEINIYADNKVEVHQNDQKIVAIGNTVANKQDNTIYADEMTAFYTKNPQGKTEFKTLHAKGNVRAVSPTSKAYGNTMDYDLKKEEIILVGTPAKIVTEKGETITAKEKIIYYPEKQMAVATGDVMADDKENKVYSDRMVSYFAKDDKGNLEMERVEIYDNVKIVTPQATATSLRGIYFPKKSLVHLYDKVIINQDGNILKGDFAETNLKTGISRMLSHNGKGRVSGVFKEKEKEKEKPQPAKPVQPQQGSSDNAK